MSNGLFATIVVLVFAICCLGMVALALDPSLSWMEPGANAARDVVQGASAIHPSLGDGTAAIILFAIPTALVCAVGYWFYNVIKKGDRKHG